MTKNDIFYKVLFALQLAILPLIIFANEYIEQKWALGLFIGGAFLIKIWLELFKDRYDYFQAIISAVSSVATFSVLLIMFAVFNILSTAICVLGVVFVVLYNVMYIYFFKTQLPEIAMAIDFCYMLFEIVALGCFIFAPYYSLVAMIGLFALLLTMVVSFGYKAYLLVRTLISKRR